MKYLVACLVAVALAACGGQDAVVPSPDTSPTGSLLVLETRPCNFLRPPDPARCDDVQLVRIGLDGTLIEVLETGPPMAMRSMALSSDKGQVAWTWNWELGLLRLADGEARTVTRKQLPENLGETAQDPTFSPDGTEIMYRWSGATGEVAWYRLDLETLEFVDVPMPVDCQALAWAPDGNRLACEVWEPAEDDPNVTRADIYLVDLETQDATPLTDPSDAIGAYRPDWSPDGRWLAISMHTEVDDRMAEVDGVWILDVETGERERIIPGAISVPTWSPDGGHIAAFDETQDRIVIVGRDGSGFTTLQHDRMRYVTPRWVP